MLEIESVFDFDVDSTHASTHIGQRSCHRTCLCHSGRPGAPCGCMGPVTCFLVKSTIGGRCCPARNSAGARELGAHVASRPRG
jgi:hypothetical protein